MVYLCLFQPVTQHVARADELVCVVAVMPNDALDDLAVVEIIVRKWRFQLGFIPGAHSFGKWCSCFIV